MKRLSFILASAAVIALCAACEKENAPVQGGETAVVKVMVSPDVVTRASGDGSVATDLYAAVYNNDGAELTDLRQHIAQASYPQQVQFSLVEGMKYKIAFLAQAPDAYLKEGAADLKAITLPAGKANDESLDLFTAVDEITVAGNESRKVQLKRPFARVNFVCSQEGIDAFKASGLKVELTQITFSKLPQTFNAVDGSVSGERKDVIYQETAPANEAFKVGYTTLAYAYLPVGKEEYLTDAILRVNGGARYLNVTNLPIKANYRTNVIGNLLTSSANYSVTIDGTFTDDTEVEILAAWDGVSTKEVTPVDNVYEISTPDELAWVAQQVNSEANTFAGKTVKLLKNINLGNKNWTPIGTNADDAAGCFQGSFDGNGKTISNLFIDLTATPAYRSAGLFGATRNNVTIKDFTIDGAVVKHLSTGSATDNGIAVVVGSLTYGEAGVVENVTVRNATVEGNRYVAGIAGYGQGTIKGCTLDGITLVATPDNLGGSYDNGDKVGGIIGYVNSGGATITDNTVKNFSIKAYRDMGGIVGTVNLKSSTVSGNTVSNGTITVDQTTNSYGSKTPNAGAVVGRVLDGSYDASTNTVDNVTVMQLVAEGLTKDSEGNYYVSTPSALSTALSTIKTDGTSPATIHLADNTYNMVGTGLSGIASDLSFVGNGEGTVLDMTNSINNASETDLHFKDLVIKSGNQDYKGIQHVNNVSYDNVTCYGRRNLYGATEVFNNCTFIQNVYDYSFWTYGAGVVTFNHCTFDSAGKALKVYKESDPVLRVVNVNYCTFKADRTRAGKDSVKAAIEIDSSLCGFEVNITNSTDEGFDPGENSKLTLYNYDLVNGAKPTNIKITIDGVQQTL